MWNALGESVSFGTIWTRFGRAHAHVHDLRDVLHVRFDGRVFVIGQPLGLVWQPVAGSPAIERTGRSEPPIDTAKVSNRSRPG